MIYDSPSQVIWRVSLTNELVITHKLNNRCYILVLSDY